MTESPKLSGLRVRLLYQTPQVYKTDVGMFAKPASLGFRYTCKVPLMDPSSNLGELGTPPYTHPAFELNSWVPKVHVHLVDKKTGEVFWDADFVTQKNLLKGTAMVTRNMLPTNPDGAFRRPCIPSDDPEPHWFDLEIQSQGGVYWDGATPFGKDEGFGRLGGPRAHIGFEVYRVPLLEQGPDGEEREVMGQWTPGGTFSRRRGATVSRYQRILDKEEDPFWKDDPIRPSTGKIYYDYIIDPRARARHMFGYLTKYAPPLWTEVPPEFRQVPPRRLPLRRRL